MIKLSEFKKLKPKEIDSCNKESFESFLKCIEPVLPNFPENILQHWVYRHFDFFCSDFWWLGYDKLSFRKEKFNKEQILSIQSKKMEMINAFSAGFLSPDSGQRKSYLGQYMWEKKLWPEPIIVLDVINSNLINSKKVCKPFHLLEGHMRLSYMRALIQESFQDVPDEHEVWIATRGVKDQLYTSQ